MESIIIEIRAGTGGVEASLFVADLFKMYSKYAVKQNWRQKILSSSQSEIGGYKEIVFELISQDNNIFSKMQQEGGVHRVQRIPKTEKIGRVHTSTVSIAVLLKPKQTEITIKPTELKIDVAKASGPGGQNVNKRMTAIRIVHLPTGIAVESSTERSLQQNKENALSILEAKLLEKKQTEDFESMSEKRKIQIKWAKRAEKIRTYNFPQNRVTDHRIKKSWHNIEDIMSGNLEPIIQAFAKQKNI
jgi:peptide chain release factor 1